jgi:hypothetical protein
MKKIIWNNFLFLFQFSDKLRDWRVVVTPICSQPTILLYPLATLKQRWQTSVTCKFGHEANLCKLSLKLCSIQERAFPCNLCESSFTRITSLTNVFFGILDRLFSLPRTTLQGERMSLNVKKRSSAILVYTFVQ